MLNPKVTVLLPVYNGASFLKESIGSILNQSYKDFELLVIDDASTDASPEILDSFRDSRIRIIRNTENSGLIGVLNTGMKLCQSEFLVRMDADDISLPGRIETQIRFLTENPQYGLCGTWFEDFGDNIPSKIVRYQTSDTDIRIRHLYQTHISHPTAAWRMSIVRKHNLKFNPEYIHGEDYAFWVEFSKYSKLANIPEVLVRKRDHPKSITNQYKQTMDDTCNKVKLGQFERMGLHLKVEDVKLYSRFANPEWSFSRSELEYLENLLIQIVGANETTGIIPAAPFRKYLAEKWFHLCYNNPAAGWKRYMRSELSAYFNPGLVTKLKFRLRTALKV